MGPLSANEIMQLVQDSDLVHRYEKSINRESAHEILTKKIEAAVDVAEEPKGRKRQSLVQRFIGNMFSQLGRTVAREVIRSFLGSLRR